MNRPHYLRLRGAAKNENPDARGRAAVSRLIIGFNPVSPLKSKIARTLLALALFWAPLGAFAHVPGTLFPFSCARALERDSSGFLHGDLTTRQNAREKAADPVTDGGNQLPNSGDKAGE